MLVLILPITALLLGVGLLLLGSGLLNTLIALRGGLEGFDDRMMGLIMSGYFLGFFIGTFLALPLIRRIGHIRSFAFCAAIMSCTALLYALNVNQYIWILFRVLNGIVLVVLYTVNESWLNGLAATEHRGKIFSVYMIVNLGALALAQQLLRFGTPESVTLFTVAAMLISLSLVPVTWTRLKQPAVDKIERLGFREMYQKAPLAVIAAILSGLVMGAFWGMAPLYAQKVGMDNIAVGSFMSIAIIGGALFQYPLGKYSDKKDRRKVLLQIGLIAAVSAVSILVLSYFHNWLLLSMFVYGGMAFAVYPLAIAHLVDRLDKEDIVGGISGLLLLYGVGAVFGPVFAGQLMHYTGHQALPAYFIVMQILLALLAFYSIKQSEEISTEQSKGSFVPMVRTTPTAVNMHPE